MGPGGTGVGAWGGTGSSGVLMAGQGMGGDVEGLLALGLAPRYSTLTPKTYQNIATP